MKGIAIGNGVFDTAILASTRVEYAYNHGLIGIDHWDQVQDICCHSGNSRNDCDFPFIYPNYTVKARNNNQKCAIMVGSHLLSVRVNVNLYNVYESCNYTGKIANFLF